ncbi:MAG: hypothetical protein ACE5HS_10805 [bacterium]
MKNNIIHFVLTLSVCILLFNIRATFGQEEEEVRHIFTISTWKAAAMPEGGSAAERDSLMMISVELQNMNPKYLSAKVLRHSWGSDFRDWVFITEYATWADIEEAAKIDETNFKKKWPDKNWEAYLRMFGRYFTTHSDEIYTERPKYGK